MYIGEHRSVEDLDVFVGTTHKSIGAEMEVIQPFLASTRSPKEPACQLMEESVGAFAVGAYGRRRSVWIWFLFGCSASVVRFRRSRGPVHLCKGSEPPRKDRIQRMPRW